MDCGCTLLKTVSRELQISIKERELSRCGRKTVQSGSSLMMGPCSGPTWRLGLLRSRSSSATAPTRGRRSTLACSIATPHCAISYVLPSWSAIVAEPATEERARSATARNRHPRAALERLVALNREKNLLTRDIVILDLRLPDRITVRLTDAAAAARIEALKDKPKKKANDA